MASEEHKKLSSIIKNVHEDLRRNSSLLGVRKAWDIHCQEKEKLEEYAVAMQTLATTFWENNSADVTKDAKSRIDWIVQQCESYFFKGGVIHQRNRENKILSEMSDDITDLHDGHINIWAKKLKLLDVGSCYNPFKIYNHFDVTAIDIAPANEQVLKCDFLNVEIVEDIVVNNVDTSITELTEKSFDIIVFSLLLEYLPCSKQRIKCCENAYVLLKEEGVLAIITPDSKHVGANAKIMKCWRFALAHIGFSRIKYEKLTHIHCMIFRKAINKLVTIRWAMLHEEEGMRVEVNIPQDIKNYNYVQEANNVCNIAEKTDSIAELFNELPEFDV